MAYLARPGIHLSSLIRGAIASGGKLPVTIPDMKNALLSLFIFYLENADMFINLIKPLCHCRIYPLTISVYKSLLNKEFDGLYTKKEDVLVYIHNDMVQEKYQDIADRILPHISRCTSNGECHPYRYIGPYGFGRDIEVLHLTGYKITDPVHYKDLVDNIRSRDKNIRPYLHPYQWNALIRHGLNLRGLFEELCNDLSLCFLTDINSNISTYGTSYGLRVTPIQKSKEVVITRDTLANNLLSGDYRDVIESFEQEILAELQNTPTRYIVVGENKSIPITKNITALRQILFGIRDYKCKTAPLLIFKELSMLPNRRGFPGGAIVRQAASNFGGVNYKNITVDTLEWDHALKIACDLGILPIENTLDVKEQIIHAVKLQSSIFLMSMMYTTSIEEIHRYASKFGIQNVPSDIHTAAPIVRQAIQVQRDRITSNTEWEDVIRLYVRLHNLRLPETLEGWRVYIRDYITQL